MHEAKTHFPILAQKVLKGERFLISKNDELVVELIQFKTDSKNSAFGIIKGQISLNESFSDLCKKFIDIANFGEN